MSETKQTWNFYKMGGTFFIKKTMTLKEARSYAKRWRLKFKEA